MGIRYGDQGLCGTRLFDFAVREDDTETRIYSLLDYSKFTLLVFSERKVDFNPPAFATVFWLPPRKSGGRYWAEDCPYSNQLLWVRPDAYIAASSPPEEVTPSFEGFAGMMGSCLFATEKV